MNTVKARIKELAGETLLRTGLWRRHLERMARRGEAIILTYHRVIEKWDRTLDYSQPGMVVTADTFDLQLTFLKQHFHIVSLSSLVSSQSEFRNRLVNSKFEIRNSKLARPMCALTFDDGWRDNYEIAFPILLKYGLPATIFLTTDFIGTVRAFWHTELMYLLVHGGLSRFRLIQYLFQGYPAPVRKGLMRLAHMEQAAGAQDVDPLIEAVKTTCDKTTTDRLIGDVGNALGLRRPLFPDRRFFLDWDQVRGMRAAGIEMGSHGCTHRILTQITLRDAEDELVRSKAEIERHTGQAVEHFAFPNGAANPTLIEAVRRAGHKSACLCASASGKGQVGSVGLPRVGMHEGVSARRDGSFSEACLSLWLFRGPRVRLA